MKKLAAMLAVLLQPVVVHLAGAQILHRYPLAGAITDTSAVVALWLESPGAVRVEYGLDAGLAGAGSSNIADAAAANDNAVKVALTGLVPRTRYYYRAVTASGTPISRVQSFTTFPPAGSDAPVTLLFGSCQQNRASDSGRTFELTATLGGNIFLQLGDWTYPDARITDYPTADGSIRAAYELRLDTTYPFARHTLAEMGVAYVWDDHDFGGGNSNGSMEPALKQKLIDAYRRYIPHHALPNGEHGIWQSFTIGNAEVFLIDDRAQRSPADSAFNGNTFAPKPGHSMLAGYPIAGVDQRTWLLDAIRHSHARWKILVSPVFFNPGAAPAIPLMLLGGRKDYALEFADKWIGYPADVDSMKALAAAGFTRNMVIVSGDAHTNVYDNGTHSIIPEFMVGNLDQVHSDVFATMKDYGLDIWTASQEGASPTIGRITIETTPRHRLIVESFDSTGTRMLSYTMLDSADAGVDRSEPAEWHVHDAIARSGFARLSMTGAPIGTAQVALFAIDGRRAATATAELHGTDAVILPVGAAPPGFYVGRMRIGTAVTEFRLIVTE